MFPKVAEVSLPASPRVQFHEVKGISCRSNSGMLAMPGLKDFCGREMEVWGRVSPRDRLCVLSKTEPETWSYSVPFVPRW